MFFLYISPILVILLLPDKLALHFLYYFVFIRVLHFYHDKDELHNIDYYFNFYYEHLAEYYGPKAELCTIHIHSHLLDQVERHGSLSMTSCFPRESYLGNAVKWCQGKKYMLEQFITWYKVDHILYFNNRLNINYLYRRERFDDKYLNKSLVNSMNKKFLRCCFKEKIELDKTKPIQIYARYSRGCKKFHSLSYERGGNAISYWVSCKNYECVQKHSVCFSEVVYYFRFNNEYYAFIKFYKCIANSLADGLLSINIPPILHDRLNNYYHIFHDKKYSYKIVPVDCILNKAIRML